MTQDFSKHPYADKDQEPQLTAEQLAELERTERRNGLVADNIQDMQDSIDALTMPFAMGLIEDNESEADTQQVEDTTNLSQSSADDAAHNSGHNSGQESGHNLAQYSAALGQAQEQAATNSVTGTDSGVNSADTNASSTGVNGAEFDASSATNSSVAATASSAVQSASSASINAEDLTLIADDDLSQLEQLPLNFDGFRIQRVDVYNWSSFNNNVKSVYFGGQNVLMTGDNGAGKSSIIDAITVLLYDVQKIVFNQAAGAEKGERNLASYVWGLYKNDNSVGVKTAFGLRTENKAVLSVIMATFYNQQLNEYVVLVQALSINHNKTNPDRFYYIGNRDFNLQNDVLPVKDVRDLGTKLRALGCERFNSFRDYSSRMQDLFGIRRTKVLDLFYKTISMKSISNISDFVRKQMLEDFSGDDLVEDLIERFDDLTEAYDSVEQAKHQMEDLAPIVERGQKYAALNEQMSFVENCADMASPYLYRQKADLLQEQVKERDMRLKQLEQERVTIDENLARLKREINSARAELVAQGGGQQEALREKIALAEKERQRIFTNYTHHSQFMQNIGLPAVESEAAFNGLTKRFETMRADLQKNFESYDRNRTQAAIELEKIQEHESEISRELQSLRLRKNNIPLSHVNVRAQICDFVGCNESDLPFVGELVKLKDSEKAVWERAIEKVLHNFAISMLVPEEYYAKVVNFVNTHNLGMRLVFYRIKERELQFNNSLSNAFGSRVSAVQQIGNNSLVRKLEYKPEPRFQSYVRQSLEKGFNYVCTESENEFRSERDALMPSGLSKKGGRNEKDDRRHERGNDFVLGWTNEEKIVSLTNELGRVRVDMDAARNNIRTLRDSITSVQNKLNCINRLSEISNFSQIDFKSHDVQLQKMYAELEELERTSDIIAALNKRIKDFESEESLFERRRSNCDNERGLLQGQLQGMQNEYQLARSNGALADECSENIKEELNRVITEAQRVLHIHKLSADIIERVLVEVNLRFDVRIKELRKAIDEISQELINLETAFTKDYEVFSKNLDVRASSWVDYKTLHDKLKADDLPKYLEAFRYKLSTETLDQFATLNAKFNSDRRAIEERINQINEIMYEVDYNPNHYIRMVASDSKDLEIQKFRADLKACTRGSIGGWDYEEQELPANSQDPNSSVDNQDQEYAQGEGSADGSQDTLSKLAKFDFAKAEEKFNEVKALIDRFKGKVNGPEIDLRWRNKVTDVKQWFDFTASEHSREDDSQVDYYEDSGGKSGGQKEKLAYTILASSLAYQYKSRQQRAQERSFRFVIIDEAFGRGSPQSVDYALTLFDKFNLQLLVATPMQKLDIIEKFVHHVAFVYRNEDTNESTVVNYELKDYIIKRKIREQINKSRALGTEGQQTIEMQTKHGLVRMNVADAEKVVNSLDERIRESQSMYVGPSQGLDQASAQENEGESAVTSSRKGKSGQSKGKTKSGQTKTTKAKVDSAQSTQAQADSAQTNQAQANQTQAKADLKQQGLARDAQEDELAYLQQDSSLLNLVRRQQAQAGGQSGTQPFISAGAQPFISGSAFDNANEANDDAYDNADDAADDAQAKLAAPYTGKPHAGNSRGDSLQSAEQDEVVSKAAKAAQMVANAKNMLRPSQLTAEEMAAAQGYGMHTRDAQGNHLSIEEFKQRQEQERREMQKHDLDTAMDKLNELEHYSVGKEDESSGEIFDFKTPINFDSVVKKHALNNSGSAAKDNANNTTSNFGDKDENHEAGNSESSEQKDVVVDSSQIQKENRSKTSWLKRLVSSGDKKKYQAEKDEIKPRRSLDSLFVMDDDDK